MARKKRVVIPNRCYHLVSRVAHRAFFFNDDEKRRFTDFLMRVASFSGVRLLGWCVMSNHFHLLAPGGQTPVHKCQCISDGEYGILLPWRGRRES